MWKSQKKISSSQFCKSRLKRGFRSEWFNWSPHHWLTVVIEMFFAVSGSAPGSHCTGTGTYLPITIILSNFISFSAQLCLNCLLQDLYWAGCHPTRSPGLAGCIRCLESGLFHVTSSQGSTANFLVLMEYHAVSQGQSCQGRLGAPVIGTTFQWKLYRYRGTSVVTALNPKQIQIRYSI